jgi:hypothetical protein
MNLRSSAAVATFVGVVLAAGVSLAATTYVDLGESMQDFTLYGDGGGYFAVGQGAGTTDGVTSTFTLSGAITGGSPGVGSGTYSLVTTYGGIDTPDAGPLAPIGVEISGSPDEFEYYYFYPSTNETLNIYNIGGTETQSIPIVVDGGFVNNLTGLSLSFVSTTCSGALASCDQGNVGYTPGSSIYGPVTGYVSVSSVPEPAAWALMLLGVGLAGAAARSRRRSSGAAAAI